MSAGNFERALSLVLKSEGGYVDDPRDPGGCTNLGVTIGTLSAWVGRPCTKAEVKALRPSSVAPIYRKRYWDAVRGDFLPAGVDYAMFDFAVNSGPDRAKKELQKVLMVAADGALGPKTMAAVAKQDADATIKALCLARLNFLRNLATWRTFGKGWKRRVDAVEREALLMALTHPLETAAHPIRTLIEEGPPMPVQADPPTLVWYKSQVLWGILLSVILKLVWVLFKWKPPIADADVADIVREFTILASFLGDIIAAHGRVSATAQPLTLKDKSHA